MVRCLHTQVCLYETENKWKYIITKKYDYKLGFNLQRTI